MYLALLTACLAGAAAVPCDPLLSVPLDDSTRYLVSGADAVFAAPSGPRACVCLLRPCFLKCCPEGSLAAEGRSCRPSPAARFPLSSLLGDATPRDYVLLTGVPACSLYREDGRFRLLPDGSLGLPDERLPPGRFCLEYFPERDSILPMVCFPEDDEPLPVIPVEPKFNVYPYGMLISIPFLLATFLAYALVPQLQNFHGMSFMCHISSLILGYSALATIQLFSTEFSDLLCVSLAYIMQFAFLATFFWLNVMCFDIWWAFSSLKKPGGSVRERDRKKFLMYSLYAWGFPFIILSITLVMDYSDLLPPDHKLKPMMGEEKCFFESIEATWLYLYGPMAVIIVANLIMFGITAKRIYLHSRETRVLQSDDSRRHDSKDKERFNLYLKLFIVMGVNWVAELVSWTFKTPSSVWYITDITNTLQGVIIFIIFVCKRRVLRLLEARLCPIWSINRSNHTASNRSRMTATTSAGTKDSNGNAKTAEVLKLKDFNDVDNSA